ncbi:MAG: efflux transporter periplasmic adaptor subunit, partial [Flavobacteriales bacterium]
MKNGKLLALLVGVMLVLAGTVYTVKHLKDQEQQAEATYGTETPRVADIVLKTLASGSVQPRQEILIKPQVSGIVRRVLVEAGDVV